jgi:hypothetical protein
MPTLLKAVAAIALLMTVHLLPLFTGVYEDQAWLDIFMHFFAGAIIAYLALAIWHTIIDKIVFSKSIKPHWRIAMYAIGILGVVAIVGVAWEWYEFGLVALAQFLAPGVEHESMRMDDTLLDLFMDLLGGFTTFIVFRVRDDK